MDEHARRELRLAKKARSVRDICVTCPASRHAYTIGEALAKKHRYPMIEEEPEYVAASLLSTVGSLWRIRAELLRLKAKYSIPVGKDGW